MNKRIQIILVTFFCVLTKMYSQKCPAPYEAGKYTFDQNEIGSICVFRDLDLNRANNVFHTSYKFKVDGGKENFLLDFYFDKINNNISIKFENKNTNTILNRSIAIDRGGSLYIFRDYKQNEPIINPDDDSSTIFIINNIEVPYVTLNQFQLMDSKEALFKLRDINKEILALHIAKIKKPVPIDSEVRNPPIDISALRREINNYRDSLLSQIEKNDQDLLAKLWPAKADGYVQKKFTTELNTICYNYFKNIFPYKDFNSQVELNFYCGADGKNLTLKSIRSINSLAVSWLEDSFRVFIQPMLNQTIFETKTIKLENENLVTEFNKRFSDRISQLNPKDTNTNTNTMDLRDSIFKIRDMLGNLTERIKPVSTEFSYLLNYQSKVKSEYWRYEVASRKRAEILSIEDSNDPITPEMRTQFMSKISFMKKKIQIQCTKM